jgi:hypothetical protein
MQTVESGVFFANAVFLLFWEKVTTGQVKTIIFNTIAYLVGD